MSQSVLRKQIMIYCLAAALPLLLLALIFNFSLLFDGQFILWTDQEVLGYIIQAEFLATASGIFIILPLLIPTQSKIMKIFRLLIFVILAGGFSWVAYDIDGMAGMVFYAILVFVSYGGGTLFVFDWYCSASRSFLSLLRWSMGIFVYVSFQISFNLDSDVSTWKSTPNVIPFGAAFFYVLSVFELIIYPPLTYYLEKKHTDDQAFAKRFNP